jgi:hypothetical protein
MIIKAAQHVYGNVEREHSPNKVGGFQTIFYTKSRLTREESEEIEAKLVYFQSDENPIKWLFFPMDSGKVVAARIVPLTSVDKFGREGSYLAHSIVLTGEDFANAGYDPFVIFALVGDRFLGTVSGALKKGDSDTADIGEIALEISEDITAAAAREAVTEAQAWDVSELKKLVHLTVNYGQLREKRQSLVFVGLPEQIKKALKVALMFVPGGLRTNCSFDTYSNGVNLVRNYSWGIGFPAASDAPPHLAAVNTANKTVSAQLPADVSPYQEWLYDCTAQGKFGDIRAYNSTALEFQKFLTGSVFDEETLRRAPGSLPPHFFSHVAGIYRDLVNAKIKKDLEAITGEKLTERLMDIVLSDTASQPVKLFPLLLDGFDINHLADALFGIYKEDIMDKPGRQEIKELRAFLRKVKHEYLGILIPVWKEDYEELILRLDRLPEAEYRDIVGLLVKTRAVPLDKLQAGARMDMFLQIAAERAETDGAVKSEIPRLIKKLVSSGRQEKTEIFSSLLNRLNFIEVKKINKIVQKELKDKLFPEVFLKSLEAAWAAFPRKRSKGFFKKILGKINVFSRGAGKEG